MLSHLSLVVLIHSFRFELIHSYVSFFTHSCSFELIHPHLGLVYPVWIHPSSLIFCFNHHSFRFVLIHSHSSLLHSFHLYNPSSLPPFPSSFCSPRPLPQSDIVHQSVYELVHSEDREELQRQLMWNSHLLPDQAQLTLQEALQADQTPLERNFTVRFRCLLDNTSGFLVSVLCYACFVSIFSGHVFFFYLLLDLSLSFFFPFRLFFSLVMYFFY